MSADVVGTAYVRIKALTDQLAKDIESNIKKGMSSPQVKRAAEAGGEDVGGTFGDSMADSAGKTLKKRSKDIVPGDDIVRNFDEITKNIQARFEKLDLGASFKEKFERNARVSRLNVRQMFDPIRDEMRDLGESFDIGDLPFFRETEGRFKRLGREIREADIDGSLGRLQDRLKGLGKGTVGLPQIGFLGKSIGLIVGGITAALPAIQDVGSAVLAYATGLVAQVGFLGTALAGVGAAAAAAIGAAGAAALPVMLAFKSETEALVEFKDSVAAAGEEFLRIGTATQQTLLPALDEALFVLGDLVPVFSEFGLFVGRAVGNYAKLATGVLVGEVAQGRFQEILQSSLRILDLLLPSLLHFGDVLSGLWVAAIPAAERFVGAIHSLAERWAEVVNEGLRTGELTNQFDLWYDRAAVLGSALGNLAGALFDILEVGGSAADDVFVRFDQWAERFRAFTESEAGQNKLALIFENSLAVMREINAVIAELFDGIFGRLDDIGGVDTMVDALQRFRDVLPAIKEVAQDAIDAIDRVVKLLASAAWDKAKETWEELAEPLGRVADQILRLLEVMNESGAFDLFLDMMRILADTLAILLSIPGFGQFIAYMIAFNAAIKVGAIVLNPFIRIFGVFSSLLVGIVRWAAAGGIANAIRGLHGLAAGMTAVGAANTAKAAGDFTALGASAASSGGLFAKAAAALGGVGGLLPVVAGAGIVLAAGGAAFAVHQHEVQRWRQEIRQATEDIGLLNDGLRVTGEGIANYIKESSRFSSNDQLDDLERLGLTAEELGTHVAQGTLSYREFADAALQAGEVTVKTVGQGSITKQWADSQVTSFSELIATYKLTEDQLTALAKGEQIYANGVSLMLDGNDSLLESYEELNRAVAASVNDNIDAFATNATNMELLGAGRLREIRNEIKSGDTGIEDDIRLQRDANTELAAAAVKHTGAIKGLSEATRDQIREQARQADGSIDVIKQYELSRDALAKQNEEIKRNLELFASADFEKQFGGAKAAVLNFAELVETTDFSPLYMGIGDNVDVLLEKFPRLGESSLLLFDQLKDLPVDEFNAAAEAMGVDADTLRTAMEGAQQAIKDLQDQALASLPSVGALLDEATDTKEDGTQVFDKKGFVDSVNERVTQTKQFGDNIARIQSEIGDEAARIAAQQGPEAAANLVTMIGHDGDQLNAALEAMEESERQLTIQIRDVLGPGLAAEYSVSAGLIGDAWGGGIASGINSPESMEALKNSSMDALNELARGFQGYFVWENNQLKFVYTGTFRRTRSRLTPGQERMLTMSDGGFVDGEGVRSMFFRAVGTDTIPAMLTPGEFVMTRTTVDRLGAGFFDELNRGGTPVAAGSSRAGTVDASGWTIVSPNPYETGRQVIARLRNASFLLGGP